MRAALTIISTLLFLVTSAQTLRKPLEASIGLGIYQNVNAIQYDQNQLFRHTGLSLSEEGLNKFYWNNDPVLIREYHFGGAVLLSQGPKLMREWLFNLDVTGQFRHHYIVTGISETMVEEQIMDSNASQRTYEQKVISISETNDLLTLRPSLSWRYHLNRRWNMRSDIRFSIGFPIKNGFEINSLKGRIQRDFVNNQQVREDRWYPAEGNSIRHVKSDYYLAFGTSLALGTEYRLFENRSAFVHASGILGRQFYWPTMNRDAIDYLGAEVKIISRF